MKKELLAGKNDAGQRVDRFLIKLFPALKIGTINKALRSKDIKINGKRTEASYKLKENDRIYLFLPEKFLTNANDNENAFMDLPEQNLSVIYEDKNIMLIDKERGLSVHADESGNPDTLINRIKKYLYDKGEFSPEKENSFSPALCNRIDRNTAGIVIAAKNAESLRILSEKIKNRELVKKYLCIVLGRPEKDEETLTAYLQKNPAENKVIVSNKKTADNLTIKTRFKVIDSFGELSLVEAELLTGRTHQIRAHTAYIGHPILGDGKYGINSVNKKYGFKAQALYSYKLKFDFSTDSGILNYLDQREFEVKKVDFVNKYYEFKKYGKEKMK